MWDGSQGLPELRGHHSLRALQRGGQHRGMVAPRLLRETCGGAQKTPGGLREAAGATSEGGGAGLRPCRERRHLRARREVGGLKPPAAADCAGSLRCPPPPAPTDWRPSLGPPRAHATWPGGRRGAEGGRVPRGRGRCSGRDERSPFAAGSAAAGGSSPLTHPRFPPKRAGLAATQVSARGRRQGRDPGGSGQGTGSAYLPPPSSRPRIVRQPPTRPRRRCPGRPPARARARLICSRCEQPAALPRSSGRGRAPAPPLPGKCSPGPPGGCSATGRRRGPCAAGGSAAGVTASVGTCRAGTGC